MPIIKPKDKIFCPFPECGEQLEGIAEDYVIPARTGLASASDEQCGYCDGEFRCLRLPDGNIDVEPIE